MPESTHPSPLTAQTRRAAFGPGLLFFLLWFVATWYYWGDLGKWSDDWSFHLRKRDGSGQIDWARILSLDPWGSRFWRPFHIRFASTLQALLWHSDWAIHLIMVGLHGLNAFLFWRVLLRFCSSRRSAAVGALLFLVCPVGYEAIFWMSTLGTTVGLACLLLCTLATQRFATGEIGWKRLAAHAPLMLTLGWWYEQPAACGPAIGFAYLACAPVTLPFARRLRTAALFVGFALFAGMLYAGLFLMAASPNQRGNAGSIVSAANVIPHAELIWRQTVDHMTLRDFGPGALSFGWRAFWTKPVQAGLTTLVFVVAAIAFGSWWMRGRAATPGPTSAPDHPFRSVAPSPFQRLMALFFGLSLFAASLVPIIAVATQWTCSRLSYIPVLALLTVIAVMIDPLFGAGFAQSRRWYGRSTRGLALAAVLPLLVAGSITMVGIQSLWNRRARADEDLARQLHRLVPSPPEHAVFLPISVKDRLAETGSTRFDLFQIGPYEASWSAMFFTRNVYGRSDVHGFGFNRWSDVATAIDGIVGATDEGVRFRSGFLLDSPFPTDEQNRRIVPWKNIIPIRIGRRGRVTLPTALKIESLENPALDRTVPVVAIKIPRSAADRPGVVRALPDAAASIEQPSWFLVRTPATDAPKPAEIAAAWASGRVLKSFALHPPVNSMTMPTAAVADLAASPTARRLAWRVSASDYLWRVPRPLTDGVGLTVWLDGRDEPLAREMITPARLKKAQDWIPIVVDIPPLDHPTRIRIQIDPGPATDPSCDWCLLTPPVLAPARSASPATATADPDTTPPSSPSPP